MRSIFISPFFDVGSGVKPSDGAKLFFFATDVVTLKDTFTTEAESFTHDNPVIANAAGVFAEIWIEGSYVAVLKDKNDVQIWQSQPFASTIPNSDLTITKDTIASMVADTVLQVGQFVSTGGYFSNGDEGGARYLIKTSAQFGGSPDENGDHTLANGNIAVIQLEVPSILQYGAVGDGATNNNAAFTDAGATGREFMVPAGNYVLTSTPTGKFYGEGLLVISGSNVSLSNIGTGLAYASGDSNVTIGSGTLANNISGTTSIAIGGDALNTTENSNSNIAIGHRSQATAFRADGDGSFVAVHNISIGRFTLEDLTTGFSNVAIGSSAMLEATTAKACVAIGESSLQELLTGVDNTAVGEGSMTNLKTGNSNVALGVNALLYGDSGDTNVGAGSASGFNMTSGGNNVMLGNRAMYGMADGGGDGGRNFPTRSYSAFNNVAVGDSALEDIDEGSDNVAVGRTSLNSLIDSVRNTAVGNESLRDSVSGNNNVAVGTFAARLQTTGSGTTAVGEAAMGTAIVTGSNNTAIGVDAMANVTSGANNTAIGDDALTLLQSASDFEVLSNCSGLGRNAAVSASNQVQLGDSATTTYAYGAVQDRSDQRDKADIQDADLGLQFINSLRPVSFKWNYREDYHELNDDGTVTILDHDGSKTRTRRHYGLIAQELKTTLDALNVDFGGYQDHSLSGGCDVKSIGYAELISPIIKAVQELTERIKVLEGNDGKFK